jgi:hypothetical protein
MPLLAAARGAAAAASVMQVWLLSLFQAVWEHAQGLRVHRAAGNLDYCYSN